jgi:imidazolonepropionase
MRVDLLIHNARQLVTCASPAGSKRGAAMSEVGLIEDGALAISDGLIVAVGATADLRGDYTAVRDLDATDRVVCPGFVDPHTHLVFAGDRVDEFERRIRGETYMQIMAAGGGIASTVRATRAATVEQLVAESRVRLDAMFRAGTTTVEVKTGYGLDTATELNMLRAMVVLDQTFPIDIVPTFLGAHAVPPEYAGRADEYVDLVTGEMLPAVLAWYRESHFDATRIPFAADVFCERNAFDVAQSRRVLEAAAARGMPVKAHVDEFTSLGGVPMALELGALSVDHLDVTSPADARRIAASNTVAIIIPAVSFNLGSSHFADARGLIDAGAAVALTTDMNPGSAPCPSQPLVMALACRYQRLLPAEALNACTINAAHAIGLSGRLGSLEPGKQADVLLVDAPDYRHLCYQFGGNLVQCVIERGRVMWR